MLCSYWTTLKYNHIHSLTSQEKEYNKKMGFSLKTLALSVLTTTSFASPLIYSRATNTSYTNANGLSFNHFNGSLPNVTILATGMYHHFHSQNVFNHKPQVAPLPAQATMKPQQQAMNQALWGLTRFYRVSPKSLVSPTSMPCSSTTSIAEMFLQAFS